MAWRWTARRLLISLFVTFHMGATVIWVIPDCPIRRSSTDLLAYYIMPLGLWQYWAMFAPDPVRDTITLEADVTDSKGLRYHFDFPRMADYSTWEGIFLFRYSKYTANLSIPEFDLGRKFASRHVVRQLALPAESYPVEVHLLYRVRRTPPPGGPPADPMTPTTTMVIGDFRFKGLKEVRP